MTHIKKQTGRTVAIMGAASGLGLELVRLFALITSGKRSHCSDGSMTGRVPLPFSGPSSSSKATMEAFADVYRTELKPFGIDFIMCSLAPCSQVVRLRLPLN